MDREEIYEMVIREMTEAAVRERNEQSPEEQELQDKVARLSKEMQEKIKDLPEDVKKAITDYVEATLLAADHDCLYLYEQGAKDCVALLKKLFTSSKVIWPERICENTFSRLALERRRSCSLCSPIR